MLTLPAAHLLQANYDMKSNEGSLEWSNSSNWGMDGLLKVTARSKLDADSVKKMPVRRLFLGSHRALRACHQCNAWAGSERLPSACMPAASVRQKLELGTAGAGRCRWALGVILGAMFCSLPVQLDHHLLQ
jgi:hypothetical protein